MAGNGRKNDGGKARFDLVEPLFEEAVAEILTLGAEEYGENSWKDVPNGVNRYYAALRRHICSWRKGEKADPETGESHLMHAACNLMFLYHFDCEGDAK